MYLKKDEKQEISKEIEKLEAKSSSELVAVITKLSSSYKFEILIISLLFTMIISLITLFFEVSAIKLFQIEVLSFFTCYFIFNKFKRLTLALIPKTYKYSKASTNAKKQFLSLEFQKTKTKQAIMFFVSIDEKYVEIITDTVIKEKINDNYWQKIIDEFVKDIKDNKLAQGYLKAIKSCNEVLIKNFPIQENDENELANDIIEI